MHSKELKGALSRMEQEDLVELLARLYKKHEGIRTEVESFLEEYPHQEEQWRSLLRLFDGIGRESSPAQCREALSSYLLVCREKKKAVKAFFAFADKAMAAFEEGRANESVLVAASSAYGRGLSYVEKDEVLWEEMQGEATRLANRFYVYNEDAAWKALRHYQEAKRTIEEAVQHSQEDSRDQEAEDSAGGQPVGWAKRREERREKKLEKRLEKESAKDQDKNKDKKRIEA